MRLIGVWREKRWFAHDGCALGALAIMIAVFVSGVAAAPAAASARAETAQFALAPVYFDANEPETKSYFIFDATPGNVIQNQVRVTNTGNAKGSARLYAVDATTGQTSGTVYLSDSAPRQDVGAWLSLNATEVTLAPGQSEIIRFSLLVPKGVRVGQHVGGIVAEAEGQQAPEQQGAIQVKVQNLTIIGVLVNLPGARVENMRVSGVATGAQSGYQALMLGLSNTGSTLLKPFGDLTVDDAQGKRLYQLPLKLDSFLPMTSIVYPIYLRGPTLDPGVYTIRLALKFGSPEQTLTYSTKLTVTTDQVERAEGAHQPTTAPGLGSLLDFLSGNPVVLAGIALAVAFLVALVFALGMLAGRRRSARSARLA